MEILLVCTCIYFLIQEFNIINRAYHTQSSQSFIYRFEVRLGHLVFLYSARYKFFPRASPFHIHTCGNRQYTHTSLYDTTCIYWRSQSSKAPIFPHHCACRCSRTRWGKVKAIHGTTLQRQEQIRWWPPGNIYIEINRHCQIDKTSSHTFFSNDSYFDQTSIHCKAMYTFIVEYNLLYFCYI